MSADHFTCTSWPFVEFVAIGPRGWFEGRLTLAQFARARRNLEFVLVFQSVRLVGSLV